MQSKNQSLPGSIKPLLFCIGMCLLALSFSISVCVSVFYAVKPEKAEAGKSQIARMEGTSDNK